MTTRPYSECLAQALALAGVPDANTTEVARVKIFINRRAKQAYAESELWPRWLVVGEERIVSEDGLLPYSQDGLRDIGTIQRIHESEPFISDPAGEYVDWNAQDDGVQITGYQPVAYSEDQGILVSGDATVAIYDFTIAADRNVPVAGSYLPISTDYNGKSQYSTNGTATAEAAGSWFNLRYDGSLGWSLRGTFNGDGGADYFSDAAIDDIDSPVDVAQWQSNDAGNAGSFTLTAIAAYSAFITYKAAFSTTYGTGDDEEDEVPEEWFEWMATGAAADFLFSDKEPEAAILLNGDAREDLDKQLAKVSRQNGAHLQTRVLSHGNMQRR